jgi:hypothetical protein
MAVAALEAGTWRRGNRSYLIGFWTETNHLTNEDPIKLIGSSETHASSRPRAITKYCAVPGPGLRHPCSSLEARHTMEPAVIWVASPLMVASSVPVWSISSSSWTCLCGGCGDWPALALQDGSGFVLTIDFHRQVFVFEGLRRQRLVLLCGSGGCQHGKDESKVSTRGVHEILLAPVYRSQTDKKRSSVLRLRVPAVRAGQIARGFVVSRFGGCQMVGVWIAVAGVRSRAR